MPERPFTWLTSRERTIERDLTPAELAGIFAMKNWEWGTSGRFVPKEGDILGVIESLAEHLKYDNCGYSATGRFEVSRELGGCQVSLKVGWIPDA